MTALLRYTLAFVAGILLPNWLSESFTWLIIGILITGLGIGLILRFTRNRYWLGSAILLLFLQLGMLSRALHDERMRANHLVHFQLNNIEAYQAHVSSLPETRAKTHRVEVEISRIKYAGKWQNASGKVLIFIDKNAVKPRYGTEMVVWGTPFEVEPPLNPAQFDYRQFLAYKQIFYQDYLKATDFVLTGKNLATWYKVWPYQLSDWSDAALRRLVPLDREYAVAKAMVLGLRDEMDTDLVQAYSVAGAVHVLSVSGFHIGVFVWLLTLLLTRLKKHRGGTWVYLTLTLGILWFYAILTGLSAPVIRSALMFTLFLLAEPFGRVKSSENALFGSALILLIFDPFLIYSVSFQLSYAALGGIIFLQPALYQSLTFKDWFLDKIWAITAVALTAQLATFPLAVYYFQQFPTYFLLANPLVVALSTAMLPIALATIAVSWIPFVAETLGWFLTGITWLLNESVVLIEKLPFSAVSGLSFSWIELTLVYLIISLLLAAWYYQEWRWLWGAGIMSVVLLVGQVVEMGEYRAQKGLIIHAVPKQTVISLIDGERAVLLADSGFFQRDKKPYNFYLKNFYNERGIQHVTSERLELPSKQSNVLKTLPFGKLIVWQGCKILLVEQPIKEAVPPVADYVLIRNTAFRKSEQLRTVFGNQKLIFDNSNKFYVLDTLQKQAITNKLPWHFVNQKGALVAQF